LDTKENGIKINFPYFIISAACIHDKFLCAELDNSGISKMTVQHNFSTNYKYIFGYNVSTLFWVIIRPIK
jgi:hypothetical protein